MKYFLSILFYISFVGFLESQEISQERAKLVAQNMYKHINQDRESISLEFVYSVKSLATNRESNQLRYENRPLFYIFNTKNDNGFIIVSGDTRTKPILGYSISSRFDNKHFPPNFKNWMDGYADQIEYIISNNIKSTKEIQKEWEILIDKEAPNHVESSLSVAPLLKTKWKQSPYENAMCPYDENEDKNCVTGCVATAMAQVMKYWNYPTNGTGSHSYTHETYGTLSADFGSTFYNWSNMPNKLNSSNNAVATLMYHCGVSVDMDYGVDGSAAYINDVATALKTYFGYASSVKLNKRDNYNGDWIDMLKSELDMGHPILYRGAPENGSGHAFVCDGYDNSDYFHFNWGWGGYLDGYFLSDALNPNNHNFNFKQLAITGVEPPPGNITYDIKLYNSLVVSPSSIGYGENFKVHTDILNSGQKKFEGDYCAAVFDSNNKFFGFVEVLKDKSLPGGGYHYTNGLDFVNSGTYAFIPGKYHIATFYKPKVTGKWVRVGDGAYSNRVEFEIVYKNDMELYEDIRISCGTTISKNTPFSVTLDVLNNDSTKFEGTIDVSIFTLDYLFVKQIQAYPELSLDPDYYYDDLTFETEGLDIEPGTYLLSIEYEPYGGSWTMVAPGDYSNPVYVKFIDNSTAIEDISNPNPNSIVVFPNPVNDILNIKTKSILKKSKIEIVNILGEQVYKILNPALENGVLSIPISKLKNGSYLILIKTDKAIWSKKFIKVNN